MVRMDDLEGQAIQPDNGRRPRKEKKAPGYGLRLLLCAVLWFGVESHKNTTVSPPVNMTPVSTENQETIPHEDRQAVADALPSPTPTQQPHVLDPSGEAQEALDSFLGLDDNE